MAKHMNEVIAGILVDEHATLNFDEFCQACGAQRDFIMELVNYGLIEPVGNTVDEWHFTILEVWRSQTALRLQRDLHIDFSGIALALDLLEELHELRKKVKYLENRV